MEDWRTSLGLAAVKDVSTCHLILFIVIDGFTCAMAALRVPEQITVSLQK